LREKEPSQLKSRFHRISGLGNKFNGCYSSVVDGKKSGTLENDIINSAHAYFSQDDGAPFTLENA